MSGICLSMLYLNITGGGITEQQVRDRKSNSDFSFGSGNLQFKLLRLWLSRFVHRKISADEEIQVVVCNLRLFREIQPQPHLFPQLHCMT